MAKSGDTCSNNHRFFCSEVKGHTGDTFVWIILVCTSCGDVRRISIPLDPTKSISRQ